MISPLYVVQMKKKIDKANIPSLGELQEMAQLEGVELIACKMTVDMMEINDDTGNRIEIPKRDVKE